MKDENFDERIYTLSNFEIYHINEELSYQNVIFRILIAALKSLICPVQITGCETVYKTLNLRKSTQVTPKVLKCFWQIREMCR